MKKIFTLMFLLIILPISVKGYQLSCDSGMFSYGKTINCRITGMPTNYDYIKGTITEGEGISCKITSHAEGFEVSKQTDKTFYYTGLIATDNLVNITCTSTSKAPAAIQTQLFVNDFRYKIKDKEAQSEYLRSDYINLNQYIEEEKGDTKPRDTTNQDSLLSSIKDDNLPQLNFSRFVTQYNFDVLYEVEKINPEILSLNPEADVRIVGSYDLNLGENIIDIYVTSPDGSSTTCYTITINRLPKGENIYLAEKDAKLKTFTISGFTINFDPDVYDYKIHLTVDQNSVVVNTTPNYPGATVDVSKIDNLKNGDIITVTVKSEDGTETIKYRVKVTKDAPKKDYTPYIIIAGFLIAVVLIILLIVYTSSKQKKDPLLSLKIKTKDKSKGSKFDTSTVPEVGTEQVSEEKPNTPETENKPIEEKEKSEPIIIPEDNKADILPETPTEPKLPRDQGMQTGPIPIQTINDGDEELEVIDL